MLVSFSFDVAKRSKCKISAPNFALMLADEINHSAATDDLAALERNQDLFGHIELYAVASKFCYFVREDMAIGLLRHEFLFPTET